MKKNIHKTILRKRKFALFATSLWLCLIPAGLAGAENKTAKKENPAQESGEKKNSIEKDLQVDLNTASENELKKLPGIGSSKAKAILALRQQRGGFKKPFEIIRVKGIGRKTFRRLKPHLTASPIKKK